MPRPLFVIVSGPPAAGKTTSAPSPARTLGMPLFSIDATRERLADTIGARAANLADELGDAALRHVPSITPKLLNAGDDVMVEGFMRHGPSEPLLAPLVAMAETVLVHLYAADLILEHRYEARAALPERHWIHGDIARLGTLLPELPARLAAPLELDVSRIFLDTTGGPIMVSEVTALIIAALADTTPHDYTMATHQPA